MARNASVVASEGDGIQTRREIQDIYTRHLQRQSHIAEHWKRRMHEKRQVFSNKLCESIAIVRGRIDC